MAVADYDVIQRAGRILRAAPEPGWTDVQPKVIAAVRAVPRGGWPLTVVDPVPGAAGIIRVTDRVLTLQLSRALRDDRDYVVTDIDVKSDDGVVQRISVELSCRYLSEVNAVAGRVRARCAEVLAEVIGSGADTQVSVAVVDVHR